MYANILVVVEARKDCIRDRAYTHLQASAVLDKFGAVATDSSLNFGRFCKIDGQQRAVVLYYVVDIAYVYLRIAKRTRDILVYDCDCEFGAFHGGERCIYRRAERYVAEFVGRTNLNHSHIALYVAFAIKFRCFAEENRNVVGKPFLYALPYIGTDKKCVMLENPFKFWIYVRSGSFGV